MSIDSLRLPKSRNRAFLEGLGSGLVLGEAERRLILVLSDSVVVCLSCLASFALFEVDARSLVLVWLFTSLAALYSADQYSLEPHRDRALLGAVFAGSLMSIVVARAFLFPLLVYPALLVAILLAGLGLLGSRNFWLDLLSLASQRLLLLCEGAEAQEACEEISRHPLSGFQAFGSMKDFQELPETLRSWRIDCVVAGRNAIQRGGLQARLPWAKETLNLPMLFERLSHRIPIRHVDERWFIENFRWNRGWTYRAGKRLTDILFASIGLLLAMPLFPPIMLAIWLDDPGPVFYRQERVGLHGKSFYLYKFRTMRLDAEKNGAVWARENDDRITRLGGFLRKTRLDEILQLFQVLGGKMSLVGPRPERPEFVQQLEKEIPFFQYRQLVLPGITGWAQVRFPYGASIKDSEEKLKFDLYYLKHRSLGFDLLILLRTISIVLNKTGSR